MQEDSEQHDRQQYLLKWLEFGRTPPEDDCIFDDIRKRVATIYSQVHLPPPQVIPCRGPMEQAIFPSLIALMLRLGREQSTNSRFCKTSLEPPAVHKEWANLWEEAVRLIDWTKVAPEGTGTGALINDRIERHLDTKIRPRIFAEVDEKLGVRAIRDDKFFKRELVRPYRALKRALMYEGVELRNFWNSFVMRLPEPFLFDLKTISKVTMKQLPFAVDGSVQESWLGGWDWYWLASIDFALKSLASELPDDITDQLDLWTDLCLDAAGYLFCERCCFVYLKPIEIFFDQNDRLHHPQKAAVEFINGTKFFFWHGMEVPEEIITHPKQQKIKAIEKERNVEIRRIMIERYGLEDFVRDAAARKIQEDQYGVLYRKEILGDEPMVIVKVTNSTPELDGASKNYFLRVPPSISTAREAVAWTFGIEEEDYSPVVET